MGLPLWIYNARPRRKRPSAQIHNPLNPILQARRSISIDRPLVTYRPDEQCDPIWHTIQWGIKRFKFCPSVTGTTWTFNVFDLPVSSKQDSLNNFVTNVYNAIMRIKIAEIDSLGNRTTLLWNAASQHIGTQNPLGMIRTNVLDSKGRIIARINPMGYAASTTWNTANQPIAQTDEMGNITTAIFNVNSVQITRFEIL